MCFKSILLHYFNRLMKYYGLAMSSSLFFSILSKTPFIIEPLILYITIFVIGYVIECNSTLYQIRKFSCDGRYYNLEKFGIISALFAFSMFYVFSVSGIMIAIGGFEFSVNDILNMSLVSTIYSCFLLFGVFLISGLIPAVILLMIVVIQTSLIVGNSGSISELVMGIPKTENPILISLSTMALTILFLTFIGREPSVRPVMIPVKFFKGTPVWISLIMSYSVRYSFITAPILMSPIIYKYISGLERIEIIYMTIGYLLPSFLISSVSVADTLRLLNFRKLFISLSMFTLFSMIITAPFTVGINTKIILRLILWSFLGSSIALLRKFKKYYGKDSILLPFLASILMILGIYFGPMVVPFAFIFLYVFLRRCE